MDVLLNAIGDFFAALGSGVAILGSLSIWVAIAIGAVIGVIVGALPGVGTTLAYALILPFTYQLDITTTIVLLMSISVGSQYGNSIPSILVGVPGSPAAALTVLDGFALHKRGQSGLALGIAFVGAVSGQIVSILFFVGAILPLAGLAYFFLQPELFSLYLFGLVAIVSLTGRNVLKGLLAVGLGLVLALIGLDPVNATQRFTFGIPWLRNGIDTTIIVIGLLAMSELFRQMRQNFQWDSGGGRFSAKFPRPQELWSVAPAMLGGTVVGTVVGAIPGAGTTPAAMIAYQNARVMSKHPERFGRGAPDGIAANEASQNASNSGELIPTLGLGIPASGSMVLLLAALSLNGFVPGPYLVTNSPELFHAVVAGLLGSSLFIIVTGWAMCRIMLRLLTINRSVVIVLSIATVVIGVYSLSFRVLDVVLCFGAGAIGYFMMRYGYSTAAAALAVVLAGGFEATLRRGLSVFDDDPGQFFGRPIVLVILTLAAVFLAVGVRRTVRFSADERQVVANRRDHEPPDAPSDPGGPDAGPPAAPMTAVPADPAAHAAGPPRPTPTRTEERP